MTSHIWVEPIRVVGLSYYIKDIAEVDGYEVELIREPLNPHDHLAIGVFVLGASGRHQIGHVPRDLAAGVRDDQLPARGVIVFRTAPPKTGVSIQA